jgi:hypothetical protein
VININGTPLQPNATGGVTGSLVAVQGTGGTLKIGTTVGTTQPLTNVSAVATPATVTK